jgi:uncharacterized membrane protein YhaH (DUF805 family)
MNWFHLLLSFAGRINRAKFWAGLLIACLFPYAGAVIALAVLDYGDVIWLFIIPSGWMVLAVCAKRLHDLDRSGWWLPAVLLIPGFILALGLLRGTEGDNRFGADPLPPRPADALVAEG